MKLFLNDQEWIDTNSPLDISIPLQNNNSNLRAWYVDAPVIEPVRANGFVGSVAEGGGVNFRNIFFNPHGHGTHTECLGHITEEVHSINKTLTSFFCKALVISMQPTEQLNDDGEVDHIIEAKHFENIRPESDIEAIIIRTMPNGIEKKSMNYSGTNPPFLDIACIDFFDKYAINHLLIDTPSVDREVDAGVLAFHHAFWKVPENPNFERTITELIFVENSIEDGTYLLEIQAAPFENDATPSRPVLYKIHSK
ncbi:MAG: cyclase family protein [Bacteroidota bacterium]